MKTNPILSILFLVGFILFTSLNLAGQAEKASADSTKPSEHTTTTTKDSSKESDFITFVTNEQKEHRLFLENMISWVSKVLLVIITLAGGIFIYFSLSSFKDIKRNIKDIVVEQSRPMIEKSLSTLINVEIDPIRKEMQLLQQFKYAQISFIGNTSYNDELLSFITPVLKNSNITRLHQYTVPNIHDIRQRIKKHHRGLKTQLQ